VINFQLNFSHFFQSFLLKTIVSIWTQQTWIIFECYEIDTVFNCRYFWWISYCI